ncbi:hypothetical protein ACSHWB_36085 [Lentzea sp. HUAS TT2]|uniref:hypothetical protein n=1 Tax=Lentzea sp. HUAS TT2 TaxID=3447454 RepID=UPI003F6EA6E9
MGTTLTTREVWRTWFARVTVGEFLGFLAPALPGALTSSALVLVLAGTAEGANAVAWATGLAVFAAITGSALTRLLDRS